MVSFLMTARLPPEGLEAFERYEKAVLPLLAGHGGRLVRRLRSADDRVEVHLVQFPSGEAFERYRGDPRRLAARPLLEASGASVELLEVRDVAS
jgi:uncharacterized protein (DUF1330 family)